MRVLCVWSQRRMQELRSACFAIAKDLFQVRTRPEFRCWLLVGAGCCCARLVLCRRSHAGYDCW